MAEGHKAFLAAVLSERSCPAKIDGYNRQVAVRKLKESVQILDPMCPLETKEGSFVRETIINAHALLAFSYNGFFAQGVMNEIQFLKRFGLENVYDMEPDFQKSCPSFFIQADKVMAYDKEGQ